MQDERHECPNCYYDASVAWGHEAGQGSGRWLCAEFAAQRFPCGCSLDFGRCPAHLDLARRIHDALVGVVERSKLAEIFSIVRMPADHYDWSFIRDASPAELEATGRVLGVHMPEPTEPVEVGKFVYDPRSKTLSGPALYMQEQGNAKLESILNGTDMVFSMTAHYSPNVTVAVLVHMQTDYAAWIGARSLFGA